MDWRKPRDAIGYPTACVVQAHKSLSSWFASDTLVQLDGNIPEPPVWFAGYFEMKLHFWEILRTPSFLLWKINPYSNKSRTKPSRHWQILQLFVDSSLHISFSLHLCGSAALTALVRRPVGVTRASALLSEWKKALFQESLLFQRGKATALCVLLGTKGAWAFDLGCERNFQPTSRHVFLQISDEVWSTEHLPSTTHAVLQLFQDYPLASDDRPCRESLPFKGGSDKITPHESFPDISCAEE